MSPDTGGSPEPEDGGGLFWTIRRAFHLGDVRPDPEGDVETEISHHLVETIDDLVARGWSREEARAEARRRFGDVDTHRRHLTRIERRRQTRRRRRSTVEAIRQSLGHVLRDLVRHPGFGAAVIVTLALGIGANATMFGVVDRLLLRPPEHIRDAEDVRRIHVARQSGLTGSARISETLTYPDFTDLIGSDAFDAVAAHTSRTLTLGRGETAAQIRVGLATPGFFPLLGVPPAMGRFFTAEEDREGAPGTVVLSHELWANRFGGDPDVLGRRLEIGDGRYTVVGVAPRGFTGVDLEPVDAWLPLRYTQGLETGIDTWKEHRNWWWLKVVVRLADGVSIEAAEAEATRLHRVGRAEMIEGERYDPEARLIAGSVIAAEGPEENAAATIATWLAGVTLIVLLIACANVANLLLARGERRRRETGIRLALGVSRGRLVGSLLLESLVLAGLGGLAALLVARWGSELFRTVLLPGIAWTSSPVSERVLLFTLAVTTVTGLAAGLLPALRSTDTDLTEALKAGAREGGRRRSTIRSGLTVVQTTLSVVLLVGAGLFLRSLQEARGLDLGFEMEHVLLAFPDIDRSDLSAAERNDLVFRGIDRLDALPVVRSAAAMSSTPVLSSIAYDLRVPGLDSLPRTSGGGPYVHAVSPAFFGTVGLSIRRGRGFLPSDGPDDPPVAVVNETFAKLVWPESGALGRCLVVRPDDGGAPCVTVVGVVEDALRQTIDEDPTMQYYVPLRQRVIPNSARAIAVAVRGDPEEHAGVVARELRAVDPGIRFVSTRPMSELVAPQLRTWTMGATVFSIFGLLALIVAAVGLYSVLAFDVAQRTRELGIRAALGATRKSLLRLVLERGLLLCGLGMAAGIALTLAAKGFVEPLLFRISPADPVAYALVIGVLAVVAAAASVLPAWRATRVDPMEALREE